MAIAAMPPRPSISVTVAASIMEMQSHSTLPPPVRSSSARWPMAKAGSVPMPITPGSCCRKPLRWPAASAGKVGEVCPCGGTYCRSSSQMTQHAGAVSVGAYWVPQAVQMKAGIESPADPVGLEGAADLAEDRRIVDGRRHGPGVAVGDLFHGAAQDFPRPRLRQPRHRDGDLEGRHRADPLA